MPKRRMFSSSSADGISVLDQLLFEDPAAGWDEKVKSTPPLISRGLTEVAYPNVHCQRKPKAIKLVQASTSNSARKASVPGRKCLPDLNAPIVVNSVAERSDGGRKVVFMLGPPCLEVGKFETVANLKSGEFFRSCFLCKKEISGEDGVLMYGTLQAFCSPDCREKKIKSDEDADKAFKRLGTRESARFC